MASIGTTTAPVTKEKDTDLLIEEYGYDDHFHDHHHGDKYQSNFITTYIFSQDHKMIAKQFLITGYDLGFHWWFDVAGFPSCS
jgi:cytochrome c oxidase subunit 1